jgi:hypothetical protein
MGNCIYCQIKNTNIIIDNLLEDELSVKNCSIKKEFISYNVLNKNKNIIIGTWNNPNKSNTLGNQGIRIGNNDKIYELTFGISDIGSKIVVLNFENNIKLKIYKDINNFNLVLTENKNEYRSILDTNIIKNYKKFDSNSPDIDLIYILFNNLKN